MYLKMNPTLMSPTFLRTYPGPMDHLPILDTLKTFFHFPDTISKRSPTHALNRQTVGSEINLSDKPTYTHR